VDNILFRQIRSFMNFKFNQCTVRYYRRSCNKVTDCLANYGTSVVRSCSRMFMGQVRTLFQLKSKGGLFPLISKKKLRSWQQPALPPMDSAIAGTEATDSLPDWTRLPEDLLVTVMGKLEVADLVRSGAVCASWHSTYAASRPRASLPSCCTPTTSWAITPPHSTAPPRGPRYGSRHWSPSNSAACPRSGRREAGSWSLMS
jgi:hypothetical protein